MTTASSYKDAVIGATTGAASLASSMAAVVQRTIDAGKVAAGVPGLSTSMSELLRLSVAIAEIDRDTQAMVKLVIGSAISTKAAVLQSANQLRQIGQQASASAGRLDSEYQQGTGDVVTDASLANVTRAGSGMVYAANEAARQLEVIAGKIKV